jgi:hypothetical protein
MTAWTSLLAGLGALIVVETVILTIALWIMIKLQKLEYNFPGLLATAVLTSALDEILDLVLSHFLGDYLASCISTPIVVVVLFICITRLTKADQVDVFFTIGVGYAVWFVLNLWLMGDLIPSARWAGEAEGPAALKAEYQVPQTNRPAASLSMTNEAAGNVARPAVNPSGPVPANLVPATVKVFSLKGIITAGKPSAMINTGVKTYSIFQGDSLTMETANGKVVVRCEKLEKDRVVLDIAGEPLTLSLPTARP